MKNMLLSGRVPSDTRPPRKIRAPTQAAMIRSVRRADVGAVDVGAIDIGADGRLGAKAVRGWRQRLHEFRLRLFAYPQAAHSRRPLGARCMTYLPTPEVL
jgi:hypothetical protein